MKRLLPLLVVAACAAPVGRESIESGSNVEAKLFEPQTIEASDPAWPTWLREAGRGRPSENGFVGQAEAPTMEAARALAMRDLYSALSSYLSIDVSSEQEDRMTESNGVSSESVREVVRARSSAELKGISADATYWERVVTSPLSLEGARYRYYVRARLKKAEIEKNRRARTSSRRSRTARQSVVILPFEAALEVDAPAVILAAGLADDLGMELANDPQLHVGDASAVRSALGGATLESDRVERVKEALSPDIVVSGLIQRDGPRVRATLVLHDGSSGRPIGTRSLERPYSALPSLSTDLATMIAKDLGHPAQAPPKIAPAKDPATSVEAKEAYHGALAAYQAGDNQQALELIHRALALSPDDGLAYLRLGRIFERLGRYARLPPSASVLQQRADAILVCTVAGQRAMDRAEAFLKERAEKLRRGGPTVTDEPPFLDVDVGLAQVLFRPMTIDCPAGSVCALPLRSSELIDSALEAYLAARSKLEAGQERRVAEIDLAIAGLARRVDRLNEAAAIYNRVERWSQERGELDLHADALAGYAAVLRSMGNLAHARDLLERALLDRSILGEKPQLLELHNDLGGLWVEMGYADQAEAHFRKAWRLSIELGNEYLQAVLLNNIGVLELRQGKIASATEHVGRAQQYLSNVGEVEGRAASGLNVGILATLAGDPEAAADSYDKVGRLIERTAQEGWLAQVAAKRGALLAGQGDPESLYQLGTAILVMRGLARGVQAERLANDVLVAELESPARNRGLYDCLKSRYWALGAPSFWMPKADPSTPTLADLPPDALEDQELITALNAASIAGLSSWTPESLIVHQRPPPRFPVPLLPPGARAVPGSGGLDQDRARMPEPVPNEQSSAPSVLEAITADLPSLPWPKEPPAVVAPTVVAKAAAHEKILGTFTADADLYILLDPALLREAYDRRAAAWATPMLGGALRIAEAKGATKARAVALLNLAAYEWSGGRADTAYALMMSAHRAFSETGDLYGLAHTYEWLGWFFQESGDLDKAGQNLGIAYRLYLKVGHQPAADRVLSYAR